MVVGNFLRSQPTLNYIFTNTRTLLSTSVPIYNRDFYYISVFITIPSLEPGEYTVTVDNGNGNNTYEPAVINVVEQYSDLPSQITGSYTLLNTTTQEIPGYVASTGDHIYTNTAVFYQTIGRRNDLIIVSGNRIFGVNPKNTRIQFVSQDNNSVKYVATQVRSVNYSWTGLFIYVPDNIPNGVYYIEFVDYPAPPDTTPPYFQVID